MRADDDGFVNKPKSIMRMIGCKEDDLKLLFVKKFLIPFESGVVVIKHWKIHNYIRKDTYTETKYKNEKSTLEMDENNAYRLAEPQPLQLRDECVTGTGTQVRLGKERLGEEREKDSEDVYKAIVSYLNEKAGTNYKHTTAKTRTAIHARLEEGFTLDDFKTVIDKKCADWLCDEKMEKYLRPETLFGTKFEGYLNAKHTERNDNDGFNAKDTSNSAKRRIGNYI
jgi:uncharacterized phage protein (TIGR02220 family)